MHNIKKIGLFALLLVSLACLPLLMPKDGLTCGKGSQCGCMLKSETNREMPGLQGCGKEKHSKKGCGMMPKELATDDVENSSEPGAREFAGTCGQCHGFPDPTQHRADDWSSVVTRMLTKMERHGMSLPGENDQAAILTFLQNGSHRE
jgi:hypothetical protein